MHAFDGSNTAVQPIHTRITNLYTYTTPYDGLVVLFSHCRADILIR